MKKLNSSAILNGFKGNKNVKNQPFQEILKGVYDPKKIDNEKFDIFSSKQLNCYLKNILRENTGQSKEIQKSVVESTYGELNKMVPITLKKGNKAQKFFIAKKGECVEILKAFSPVNDDEDYFDKDEDFDEEEVLEFIKNNEADDDALIDEFGDDIIEYLNQLHEDGKIDVDEDSGVYVVKDSSNDKGDEEDKDNKEEDKTEEDKEKDDKEADLDDKEKEDKKGEEDKEADLDDKKEKDKEDIEKDKDDEDADKDNLGGGSDLGLKGEEIGDRFEDKKEKEDKNIETDNEEEDQTKENLDKEEEDINKEKEDLGDDDKGDDLGDDLNKDKEEKKNPFNEGEKENEDLDGDNDDLNNNSDDDNGEGNDLGDDFNNEDLNDKAGDGEKEKEEEEYTPEELERMAKETATSTLVKFYQNSNDENKKDIVKLELKIRGVDVDTLGDEKDKKGNEDDLPETREELKKLEGWVKSMFADYDREDLRDYVTGLVLQSPAKRKELKDYYRDYYKMNNAGNTLAKVDNEEFKTWLTDTYFKNFSDGDLQQYALNLVSKNPIEYNKLKKTYKTYEENGML